MTAAASKKKPCNHKKLDPKTRKCEDCGEQIYPAPETTAETTTGQGK
ncbi:hypothetical protein Sm713_22930 [Streptomyces sp. TS71-3]|nr:hypothetical protein Sm713_22930 [Streptomyces sp. TS71-3]